MSIIYRAEAVRLSVAEAKRLILDALPAEKFGQVIARTTPDGEIDWSGPLELRESQGKPQKDFIDEEFKDICRSLAIQPLMRWRPSITGYPSSPHQDDMYSIAHEEFVGVAGRYGLAVEVRENVAPEPERNFHHTQVDSSLVDFARLATPDELIAAFGKFTGMDASWFHNLKDSPALLAARKHKGTGGRKFTTPLFCPYEVMLWLLDEGRKKGRHIQPDTAWRMFKQHFPKAYEPRAIGDPNEDE